jgi:hypothetical protein
LLAVADGRRLWRLVPSLVYGDVPGVEEASVAGRWQLGGRDLGAVVAALLLPPVEDLVALEGGGATGVADALRALGRRLEALGVDVVLALDGRWRSAEAFSVDPSPRHVVEASGANPPSKSVWPGDEELGSYMIAAGLIEGIRVRSETRAVDALLAVALHRLVPDAGARLVPMGVALRSPEECRRWGEQIAREVDAGDRTAALVAVGALASGPSGSASDGAARDDGSPIGRVVELLTRGEGERLLRQGGASGVALAPGALETLAVALGVVGTGAHFIPVPVAAPDDASPVLVWTRGATRARSEDLSSV